MMVVGCLLEANATVTAWPGTGFVQVDVHFGMPKGSSSAITNRLPAVNKANRLIVDHLHSTQWLRLEVHISLLKTGILPSDRASTLVSGPSGSGVGCLWCRSFGRRIGHSRGGRLGRKSAR